ncbi:hypothetical protein MKW92_032447 [Papaver armeniacum]|nr:hypothetical protein MKW92_032447 [Papaver armeniacum]
MDSVRMLLFILHSIHGSLLSVGELLRNSGEFMMSRYRELKICMDHILAVLRIPAERASGFIAVGEMAGALDGELVHYLLTIMNHLRDAVSLPLVESPGCHVFYCIPSLLPTIQERLLDSISVALLRTLYSYSRTGVVVTRGNVINNPNQVSELSGSALIQLALQTLARFNFKGHELVEFARASVVVYLEDEDGATRRDAALCCCRLVANFFSGVACAHFSSSRPVELEEGDAALLRRLWKSF